tara:strand:- start:330 stop:524 length:195 start_codon:yes stop_codon:yes gene_type:complete
MTNAIQDLYEEMKTEYKNSEKDMEKFCDGNSSAGTRVRKAMQNIKNLCQDVRSEVQAQKNGVPV